MNWLQRLILGDPGPVPPVLPDELADLPVMPAEILDGAAATPAPAEMPSDELMERELAQLWIQAGGTFVDFSRALYLKGRADERTAILRAMGMEP